MNKVQDIVAVNVSEIGFEDSPAVTRTEGPTAAVTPTAAAATTATTTTVAAQASAAAAAAAGPRRAKAATVAAAASAAKRRLEQRQHAALVSQKTISGVATGPMGKNNTATSATGLANICRHFYHSHDPGLGIQPGSLMAIQRSLFSFFFTYMTFS